MNKIIIFFALVFLSTIIHGQQSIMPIKRHGGGVTTLFEYGKPINSIEANFKNLFINFPKFVTNATNGYKLLSYKYCTQITRKYQIIKYLKKNSKVYLTDAQITMSMDSSQVNKSFIHMYFPPHNLINNRIDKDLLKEKTDTFASHIRLGYEVYVLSFTAVGKVYDFYMFVNPNTKKVLTEGNFLGFDIPVYYADYYSKNPPSTRAR